MKLSIETIISPKSLRSFNLRIRYRFAQLAAKLTFLEKWLILGTVIGAASGLFASFFYVLLELVTSLTARFLGAGIGARGYTDLGVAVLDNVGRVNTLLVIPAIAGGAVVSSLLVFKFAPEAEGHGTDAAIRAFHRFAGILRTRVPVIKAIASAFTIGTGGSGGVEGPSALMGAGIGSTLAQRLRLGLWDRRIALVSGMAGALSALFRAPIGTAIFSVEVLFRRDIAVQALVPSLIAAIVGYAVTLPFWGYSEVFPKIRADTRVLYTASAIGSYIILAFFAAIFGLFYVFAFYKVRKLFSHYVKRTWLRPVLGALITGIMGLILPHILGSGRQLLTRFLEDPHIVLGWLPHNSTTWIALALIIVALAKMVATAFSIGTGGSGGVFAPGIMAGALIGYAYGVIIGRPLSGIDPLIYSYLGMSAFFAAASKTPLATSLMVAEMSGNYGLLVPALLASYLAREISGEYTIYESQLPHRVRPEVVNIEAVLTMLRRRGLAIGVKALEIHESRFKPLKISDTVAKAIELIAGLRQHIIPIIDEDGRVLGAIDASFLEKLLATPPGTPIGQIEIRKPPIVYEDEDLVHIMTALEEAEEEGIDYAIVVNKDLKYKGVILYQDIVAATIASYLYTTNNKRSKIIKKSR
ncbi:chloride channel protein [Pyrofollis japonicus]|uniref:chloride channel protein n=1 Tax=Pyrofollis japonicus TaxID=3060460 RepID=UPI00295B7C26|nr:chloride channel protein [Pyrofollis japonicus]